MKTKELIEALKKNDPSGELEVSVGKTPIYVVERMPAYYDGKLRMLVQDHSKDPYYNVVGGIITDKGHHLNIHTLDPIDDLLLDFPDAPITLDLSSPERIAQYGEMVEERRIECKKIHAETEEYIRKLEEDKKAL